MFNKENSFNKKNKYKCECVQKPKVKQSIAGCENDAAAVTVLPYQWNPTRGGPILAKYLKEREEKHTKAVIHLKSSTELINKKVETKIRALAETLLSNINNNQCDIDCVIKRRKSVEGSLSSKDRTQTLITIGKNINARVQDISEFKEQAMKLERERANDLKKVLHDSFRSIIDIGHISPKDVLKEFDDKMYEVNQQLLSNCSAYFELVTQLLAQADQSQRKARSLVNQLSLGVAMTQRGGSALHCPSDIRTVRKRSKSADLKVNTDELLLNNEITNEKDFDIFITTLTDEYQKSIANLYKDFLDILKDFHKRTGYYDTIHNKDSWRDVVKVLDEKVDEIIKHLADITFYHATDISKKFSEFNKYIKLAQKKLIFIGNELNVTFLLIHEASHLWDNHMIRIALAQKLTLAAVEDLVSRNDSMELANEVTFNVALDQLATANDVVHLNQCYDVLDKLLQKKSDEYLKHTNAEIERLNEFENVRIPLTNTVKAELDLFLYTHPIPTFPLINEEDNLKDARLDFSGNKLKDAFAQEIFQIELQVKALSNWRNGFLEQIENNLQFITGKIEQQINLWVKERSSPLIKRYSLKMMSLDVSRERVSATRDLRLAEITKHEQCLQSHLGAIDDFSKSFPVEVSQYITLDTPGLHPFHIWVNNIEKGMKELEAAEVDVEVKRLKVMSYSIRLAKHRQLFEESLNPKVESCNKVIKNRILKAMVSNLSFISSIKLLHEGGNHSAIEAIEMSSFLEQANNALESCLHNSLSVFQQHCNEIIVHVDTMISPLQTSAKATLIETEKSIKDTKKLLGKSYSKLRRNK